MGVVNIIFEAFTKLHFLILEGPVEIVATRIIN